MWQQNYQIVVSAIAHIWHLISVTWHIWYRDQLAIADDARRKWLMYIFTFNPSSLQSVSFPITYFCTLSKRLMTSVRYIVNLKMMHCGYVPISAHPSYLDVIIHKIINHLPLSFHKAYIQSSIWLGISIKWMKINHLWVDSCTKLWNKRTPTQNDLCKCPGANWNEYCILYF